LLRQTQKLPFAGGHEFRPNPVALRRVLRIIAMIKAVEEHLDAIRCPIAKARRERRPGLDWRIPPVVRHNEHSQTIADMRSK
jgi:hypothetical protein